jgi:hypothetical protein
MKKVAEAEPTVEAFVTPRLCEVSYASRDVQLHKSTVDEGMPMTAPGEHFAIVAKSHEAAGGYAKRYDLAKGDEFLTERTMGF